MPQSTTGVSPSELLMGYRLRSRMDLIFPDIAKRVENEQAKQKMHHDNSKRIHTFSMGDLVYTKNFSRSSEIWLAGKIARISGLLSCSFGYWT